MSVRSRLGRLGATAAAAIVLSAATVTTAHAAPVQSPSAAMERCGWSPEIYFDAPRVTVTKDNAPVWNGPGSDCINHSTASKGLEVFAGCSYRNRQHGTWWVMTEYGWIYSGNLSSGWVYAPDC